MQIGVSVGLSHPSLTSRPITLHAPEAEPEQERDNVFEAIMHDEPFDEPPLKEQRREVPHTYDGQGRARATVLERRVPQAPVGQGRARRSPQRRVPEVPVVEGRARERERQGPGVLLSQVPEAPDGQGMGEEISPDGMVETLVPGAEEGQGSESDSDRVEKSPDRSRVKGSTQRDTLRVGFGLRALKTVAVAPPRAPAQAEQPQEETLGQLGERPIMVGGGTETPANQVQLLKERIAAITGERDLLKRQLYESRAQGDQRPPRLMGADRRGSSTPVLFVDQNVPASSQPARVQGNSWYREGYVAPRTRGLGTSGVQPPLEERNPNMTITWPPPLTEHLPESISHNKSTGYNPQQLWK